MGKRIALGDISFEARAVGGKIELTFVITAEPERLLTIMDDFNLEVEDGISGIDLGA